MISTRGVLENQELCCGCGNCYNKCPKQCIEMVKSQKGFSYPVINTERCINCGICEKVCPVGKEKAEERKPDVYCAYALDEDTRLKGSSGSIFGIVAKYVLQCGGSVYGAAFDDCLQLRHVRADSEEEMTPLYKSKYLESSLGRIFFDVENRLKENKRVLFCGTPCQCVALSYFLGKEYDNLLVMDFLCHGVPSQEMFNKSVQQYENRSKVKIKAIEFRSKPSNIYGHRFTMAYVDKKGNDHTTGILPQVKFTYYRFYSRHLADRPSCYGCGFATISRPTDFTLGDFWRLNNLQECNDFEKGYSMLFVRSEKAERVLDELKGMIYLKPYSLTDVIDKNPPISEGTTKPKDYNQFEDDYKGFPFSEIEKKYMMIKMGLFHRGVRFFKRMITK